MLPAARTRTARLISMAGIVLYSFCRMPVAGAQSRSRPLVRAKDKRHNYLGADRFKAL